jgi:putative intracellular protease/amidase
MPGAERLRDSQVLKSIMEKQAKSKKAYAAICAAPVVSLQSWGLLEGLHVCYFVPSFLESRHRISQYMVHTTWNLLGSFCFIVVFC